MPIKNFFSSLRTLFNPSPSFRCNRTVHLLNRTMIKTKKDRAANDCGRSIIRKHTLQIPSFASLPFDRFALILSNIIQNIFRKVNMISLRFPPNFMPQIMSLCTKTAAGIDLRDAFLRLSGTDEGLLLFAFSDGVSRFITSHLRIRQPCRASKRAVR